MIKKTKHKRIRNLFMSLLALFLLYSCQAPEEYIEDSGRLNGKFEIVQPKKFGKNSELMQALKRVQQEKQKALESGREVISTLYDFSVETNAASLINHDGTATYTFAVKRPQPNGLYENLVLSETTPNHYEAFLYQYQVSSTEWAQLLAGSTSLSLENKLTILPVNDQAFISNLTTNSKMAADGPCYITQLVYVEGRPCGGTEQHSYGDLSCPLAGSYYAATPGQLTFLVTQVDCGGGPSNTTGTGTGGGPKRPISSPLPIYPAIAPRPQTPCETLKSLGESTLVTSNLTELEGKTTGTQEFGFYHRKNELGFYEEGTAIPQDPNNPSRLLPKITDCKTYGMSHNHTNKPGAVQMFSDADIFGGGLSNLIGMAKSCNTKAIIQNNGQLPNAVEYFFTVAVKGPTGDKHTYAVVVKDYSIFWALATNKDTIKKLSKKLRKNYKNLYYDLDENETPTLAQKEKAFLSTYKNSGFGLYFATDTTFKNWSEVNLTTNGNNTTKTPCQ
jgi:hypothetical protein